MPFCINCGAEYQLGSKFCASCGNKLDQNAQPTSMTTKEYIDEEKILWEGKPSGLTARALDKANLNSTTYMLTNQRLIIKTGLIGKKQEEMELIKVKDIIVKQGITERALGIGDITIASTDPSTPVLKLNDVKKPMEVKEMIRNAVRAEKNKQGVKYEERL
ncbi:zinc-ribbon domain-containing protein [Biomaibacter acetigenes]|uniref:Zinc-ribbon domain-containing protein n=1 Tax=Biomaibacter acetigenes TaxID=2316383 RepID=A0A3G2R479_9FIRM|nr:PH domain-containing protein [Biomaibacter acetigenes]AYO30270.1 zinc-ribbon domain-containing protein [Biomaibacter acetigenes]